MRQVVHVSDTFDSQSRGGAGYVMVHSTSTLPTPKRGISTMITKNLIEYRGKTVRQVLSSILTLAKERNEPVTLRTEINEMIILPSMTEGDLLAVKNEYSQKIDEAF